MLHAGWTYMYLSDKLQLMCILFDIIWSRTHTMHCRPSTVNSDRFHTEVVNVKNIVYHVASSTLMYMYLAFIPTIPECLGVNLMNTTKYNVLYVAPFHQHTPFLWKCLYQVIAIAVFPVFRLLTDFVYLLTYEFCLSLWKIAWSSVILLLPLFAYGVNIVSAWIYPGMRKINNKIQ